MALPYTLPYSPSIWCPNQGNPSWPWSFDLNEEGRIGQIIPESVRVVASYNWMRMEGMRDEPTIVVPGCPRRWISREYPFLVPRDTGMEYKDANTEQFAGKTWHPLFLSVKLMEPDFNFESLDVIADKSGLRNLFRWTSRKGMRDFVLEAQLYGENNTLLLTSPNPERHTYKPGLVRRSVELFHTDAASEEWEDAGDHYRIITYTLGSMNLMVRFPVDISYPPEGLQAPSLTSLKAKGRSSHGLNYIHHEGSLVYQNSTAEIMVRCDKYKELTPEHWDDLWHRLYFSWSGRLLVVYHIRDQITGSESHFLSRSNKIQNCITKASGDLKRFEDLLNQIRQYVLFIQDERRESKNLKLRFKLFKDQLTMETSFFPARDWHVVDF